MAMKLLHMSMNTIKWGCLYSGVGITYSSPEKELDKLFINIDSANYENNIFQNLKPLKCIYKKAKPEFNSIYTETSKPINYAWIPKSFTKEISPSTQSYTILALCNLAEHIHREDLVLGNILVKNAELLYDFISTYLRNEDGLFISVDDKTKSFSGDVKVKSRQKDPKLTDQLCVFEALLCLNNITSKNEFMEYFNPQNSKYLSEARSIFNYIYENYHDFLELTSKQISLSISTLVRCCKYEKDTEQQTNYDQLIALFCAELESRIKVTGELERSFNNPEVSSFITHFRAASALLEGSMETGIKKFELLSIRIYDYLIDLFDYSMGLFVTGDSTELNYSIRDIAEILKGLYIYYSSNKKDRVLKIIIDFYTSAIEKSGIIPSITERDFMFNNRNIIMPNELPLMSECNRVPVFLKSFRFVFKKTQTFTTSKFFTSNYAFYSCYLFLMFLAPIIDIE